MSILTLPYVVLRLLTLTLWQHRLGYIAERDAPLYFSRRLLWPLLLMSCCALLLCVVLLCLLLLTDLFMGIF